MLHPQSRADAGQTGHMKSQGKDSHAGIFIYLFPGKGHEAGDVSLEKKHEIFPDKPMWNENCAPSLALGQETTSSVLVP